MVSSARLLLALPAATAFQLCMDITAPLETQRTPCCDALVPQDDGQFCCRAGGYNMCFDEAQQVFRRTFNSTSWQGTNTLYYREYHLGADHTPGSYFYHAANYFAEPGHPRLNYAKTEITVSPSAGSQISGKASQPLSVTAGASELELCFGRVAPFELSKPCCHAVGTNEDGHWCCVSESGTTMCLDENTHMFWTRYNRTDTMYHHEWYVEAPTSHHEYHYTHTEAYFAEPDHPRLNYERDEIRVTPVATRSEALV